MKTATWTPEKIRSGESGYDASILYKTYRGHKELSPEALLARETVQNSGDAADEHARRHPKDALKGKVVFRFEALTGKAKADMVARLDLDGLKSRREEYLAHKKKDPLEAGSALETLDDPTEPLRLIYVEDFSAHGLYGCIDKNMDSVLYQAMYSTGGSNKPGHAGGSFGFGKGAMAAASRLHTVLAHSVFENLPDDDVQERLVGATWWEGTAFGSDSYNGRSALGCSVAGGPGGESRVVPFEGNLAHDLAEDFGFTMRDSSDLHQMGTSFLIVDTFIDPQRLLDELSMWWWPALEAHKFDLEVWFPGDKKPRIPQPATVPFLKQFLHPYRLATGQEQVQDPTREWIPSDKWRTGGVDLGDFGLVFPESPIGQDDDGDPGGPLIAYMRSPLMVVNYGEYPRMKYPLRGVFIASEDSDPLLRKTEGSAHEAWTTAPSPGQIDEAATERANVILAKVKDSTSQTSRGLNPPPPKGDKALTHFAKLMAGFTGKKRGPKKKPTPGGEPIEISGLANAQVEPVDDTNVRVEGRFAVGVMKKAATPVAKVTVSCQLHVTEDENPNGTSWEVKIRPIGKNHNLIPNDDESAWTGLLVRDSDVTFKVKSREYPNLWTTTLRPQVDVEEWSDL